MKLELLCKAQVTASILEWAIHDLVGSHGVTVFVATDFHFIGLSAYRVHVQRQAECNPAFIFNLVCLLFSQLLHHFCLDLPRQARSFLLWLDFAWMTTNSLSSCNSIASL
jgi:hypothetical protein